LKTNDEPMMNVASPLEDEIMYLRNVCSLSADYKALYPERQKSVQHHIVELLMNDELEGILKEKS
jgi:hypothetical protein